MWKIPPRELKKHCGKKPPSKNRQKIWKIPSREWTAGSANFSFSFYCSDDLVMNVSFQDCSQRDMFACQTVGRSSGRWLLRCRFSDGSRRHLCDGSDRRLDSYGRGGYGGPTIASYLGIPTQSCFSINSEEIKKHQAAEVHSFFL